MENTPIIEQRTGKFVKFLLVLMLLTIITLGSILYFKMKHDIPKLQQNITANLTVKDMAIRIYDSDGNDISIPYTFSLNDRILVNGMTQKGITEVYKNITENMTRIDCGGSQEYTLSNSTEICLDNMTTQALCEQNRYFWDKSKGCYIENTYHDNATDKDIKNFTNIDLTPFCNGQIIGSLCFYIIPPKSKMRLYLNASSELYYWGIKECSWRDDECILRLDRKPNLNITYDYHIVVGNMNNGIMKDLKICAGWDSSTITFDLPAERVDVPREYQLYYDKCYKLIELEMIPVITKTGESHIDIMILGDLAYGKTSVKETFIK